MYGETIVIIKIFVIYVLKWLKSLRKTYGTISFVNIVKLSVFKGNVDSQKLFLNIFRTTPHSGQKPFANSRLNSVYYSKAQLWAPSGYPIKK